MTTIKPPFKWTGSKQRMLAQYENKFFPSKPISRYVDLFAGALTNVLWVHERHPEAELVINDFNSELIQLYRDLADHEDEVTNVWETLVSRWLSINTKDGRKDFYYKTRDVYCLQHEDKSSQFLSGLLLFMLMVNFNGMWKAYIKCNLRYSTPPGTCTQEKKFFDEKRENIKQVAEVLRKATIVCGDFSEVELQDGDFVYADPPYRDSIVDYQGGFTEDDQKRLAELLTSHNGDFAYSNKDIGDGWMKEHFSNSNIYDMTAKYTAGRGKSTIDVKEVLITNY